MAAPTAPPVELMRSLFDLTPSESRVARGLAAGETLEEIAANGGVAMSGPAQKESREIAFALRPVSRMAQASVFDPIFGGFIYLEDAGPADDFTIAVTIRVTSLRPARSCQSPASSPRKAT